MFGQMVKGVPDAHLDMLVEADESGLAYTERSQGELENTLILFTSDNRLARGTIGKHGWSQFK